MTLGKWNVDRILNVVFVLVAALTLGVAAKHHFRPAEESAPPEQLFKVGTPFELSGVNWSANRNTLVMALSTGCHWCRESAEFYRNLLRSNTSNKFHPLAVFPQPVADSVSYLHTLGVAVPDVRQINFGLIGVAGTPTLVLVDSSGHVKKSWVGKLTQQNEKDVYKQLGVPATGYSSDRHDSSQAENPTRPEALGAHRIPETPPAAQEMITAAVLRQLLQVKNSSYLLDIRDRPLYREEHIAGAHNIPADELPARVLHEVPTSANVILYCGIGRKDTLESIEGLCSFADHVLTKRGYVSIKKNSVALPELQLAGVTLEGATEK